MTVQTLITRDELFALADKENHPAIERMLSFPGTTGVVVYQCLNLSSRDIGACSFMRFGPDCTYKTLDECYAGHLGDLPSQRRYPVSHYLKPTTETKQ